MALTFPWNCGVLRMRPDITISVRGMYEFNNSLFDKFQVPEQIDKKDVVDSIIFECAELPLVYTNWDVLKVAIGLLSKRRIHAWERMATALFEDYNPLHNFDRYEESTDDENTNSSGNTTSVNTVNGYNGDAEHDKQNTDGKSETRRGNNHSAHLYGNIGVTTSAKMLEEELEIRKNDLISIIVREFKENFCIMVY